MKSSYREDNRGIVLISALILVLVLTMFIGALHQTGLRSMLGA